MKAHRPLTVALMLALALSLGVECLAGPQVPRAQMPCCSSGAHDCGAMLTGDNCCRSERTEGAQVAKPPAPPVAVTVLTNTLAALARPRNARAPFDLDANPPDGSPPPKYILLATFLI